MKEKITHSAIRTADRKIHTEPPPGHHLHLCQRLAKQGYKPFEYNDGHGFYTNTGRFVDREEALAIAVAAKQVDGKDRIMLHREDIWP